MTMTETRPNILLIMADQMSAKALPMYGNKMVRAPALSYLAERGVVFRNAYCASPLCGPSRMSMMTGVLPSSLKTYDNATELSASWPTFAHHLRRLGYRTVLSGKMHFVGPDQYHGYESRLTTDIYPADFSWTPNWQSPGAKVRFQNMENVLSAGLCARSMQLDYDEDVVHQASRQLFNFARIRDVDPFFMTVSFTHPHDPYTATSEYWNLYHDEEIDLPEIGVISPKERDWHTSVFYEHYGVDDVAISEDQVIRARRGYFSSISYIDAKIQSLLSALKITGLDKNTVIIFTSDHGDMVGERGLWYKKCFFEWSVRVPLIIYIPKLFESQVVSEVVSLVDLLPTLVSIGGGNAKDIENIDGVDVIPIVNQKDAYNTRSIYGEYLAEGVVAPVVMIRGGEFKFIYSSGNQPLLFNVEVDPTEIKNLAQRLEYQAIVAAFESRVRSRWNMDSLTADIIESQNQRRMIHAAQGVGCIPKWDLESVVGVSNKYVRRGDWTSAVEAEARLPVS